MHTKSVLLALLSLAATAEVGTGRILIPRAWRCRPVEGVRKTTGKSRTRDQGSASVFFPAVNAACSQRVGA